MGTAPRYTGTVTDAGVDGSQFTVQKDEGQRFADLDTPFTVLVWPGQTELPTPANSAEVVVTAVRGDDFDLERGDGLDIRSGQEVAFVRQFDSFDVGEHVVLEADQSGANLPDTLTAFGPDGKAQAQSGLGGEGTVTPDRSGLWRFRWDTADGESVERGMFYVRF